jgi:hypothetical protein
VAETFEVKRVDRIADILYGVATGKGMIDYARLARRIGVQPNHLSQFLDQVSRRAAAEGEPMWSALVVSKKTQRPLSGFYGMARRLRPEYTNLGDEELWIIERDRCYAATK